MNKGCFIRTTDEEVAKKLRESNYQEVGKQGSFYCFVNNGNATFSAEDEKNISYTNVAAMVTP